MTKCPKCDCWMVSLYVDTAGAHYKCPTCGYRIPEDMHTYATSGTGEPLRIEVPVAKSSSNQRAHWIEDHGDLVCSNCGARYSDEIVFMNRDKDFYDLPHCPTCGEKMEAD